nr:immunoglobulin heavy chain junction region [Mus musculus]
VQERLTGAITMLWTTG